ncbi:unnamed protein product [Heterotrigona itama]|uniref:Uncharacterized protein n=1 Tax=Heterotrigona itama TaxID=395501 RepID=A0A6V7GZW0_9HYME|nr:unnamed protein product [Heterotrigona itama]
MRIHTHPGNLYAESWRFPIDVIFNRFCSGEIPVSADLYTRGTIALNRLVSSSEIEQLVLREQRNVIQISRIKYVTILLAIFILVQSQRPPYAGSSKPYPAVLPQYLEAATAGAGAGAGAAANNNINGTIGNRIDSNNGNRPLMAAPSIPMAIPTIPPDLPVDALGDVDLVNRIKTWPKDKQPFWFLNWQQIQEHRGDSKNRAQPVETQPNQRSFFAG